MVLITIVPGRWLVPALFAVVATGIAVDRLLSDPSDGLIGLGLVLVGLPLYCLGRVRPGRTAPSA